MAGAPPSSFDDFLAAHPEPKAPGDASPAVDFDDFMKQHGGAPTPAMTPEGQEVEPQENAIGRIVKAFGQGAAEGFGTERIGLSEESKEYLKKAGLLPDHEKGEANFWKAANEAVILPAASGLDAAWRGVSGAFRGAQGAVAQTGAELGQPELGRELAAFPEAEFGGRSVGHVLDTGNTVAARGIAELQRAKALGVIGAGEAGWKGTAEHEIEPAFAPPENVARETEVAAEPGQPPSEAAVAEPPAQPAPVTPPDIHATVRNDHPEVFSGPEGYDALSARRDTFRRWIDELDENRRAEVERTAPHTEEIAALEARLENATPRMAKKYTAQLDDLRDARQAAIDDALKGDTPDMARIREEMQKADYAMRDLAPQVSAAYRDARAKMPTEEPVPESAVPPAAPAAAAEAPAPAQAEPVAPPAAEPVKPTPVPQGALPAELRGPSLHIANDVAEKLTAAGRPVEEANAAAAVVAAHYEARSARFGGAKGTAEDLYRAEAPEVRAGRQPAVAREREMASGSKRGSIALRDGRNVITLMKDADASTFMHETAHDWLEELMRDSRDIKAPGDLKNDANTITDWLSITDKGAIPRIAHEKFARGFERYLMEGVAPSKGLAAVFAKFKDWLTKIYTTVNKLRAPINDDIRGVFDRLLYHEPGEAVIAPERETAKSFADHHEELADTTPPERAGEVADAVRAEADAEAAKEPLIDERINGPRPRGEAGGDAPAGAQPHGAGAERGAEPAADGTRAEPGAVGEGGDEAPTKGAGARPEPTPAAEHPVGPNEPFAERGTPLVDKAGNIRLDNLGTPEDVNEAIRDAAAQNGDFLGARRGVLSDAQVLDLADALGMDAASLNRRKIGEAFSAEQIIAARKLLISSATHVRDMAAAAAEGSEADVSAFAEAVTRHRMVQEQVAGITAEAGRALRAFRDIGDVKGLEAANAIKDTVNEATGRTLNQMRSLARMLNQVGTAGGVSRMVRAAARPGLFDWIQSLFVNNLISGPLTHAGYTIAGEMLALRRAVVETGTAGLVGATRAAFGAGPAERASVGEVPYQVYGMGAGAWRGIKSSWQAFKSNTVALPAEVQRISGTAGMPVGRMQVIPNLSVGGVQIPIGTVIESPGRLVAALHTFNWTTFYTQSMAGQAFRAAFGEGKTGQALATRVAEIMANPTDAMIKEGITDANGGALMNRPAYDSLMGNVSRLTNWGVQLPDAGPVPLGTFRPLKYIDPFVQIQANVQKAAFGGTPLALFSQTVRDDLMMRNGGVAFDRSAGKIIAGTSFMIGAGWLAAQGILNHSGPSNPQQSREWQRVYGMPHGLTVGNLSFDVLRLGPIGMQMSVAADLYHAASHIGQEDGSKVSAELVHAFAQNIVDESFMRGPAEIMRAVDDSDRYGEAWIRNFAKSFVPFSVGLGQVAREIDPYSRQARTTMEAIKAIIPGVSETLQPRRDVWGEPVPTRGWAGTYYTHIANDPVDKVLYPLGVYPSLPERKIRGVELTEQQYDDYSRVAGRLAKMRLNMLVASPGFTALPAQFQIDAIHTAIARSREVARNEVMMRSLGTPDDIIKQANDTKMQKLARPAPEAVH